MTLIDEAKELCRGQEQSVLTAVCGASPEWFDGRGRPCPKCGGNDRFSWNKSTLSFLCRKCFTDHPDCIGSVAWLSDLPGPNPQAEAAKLVMNHFGKSPAKKKKSKKVKSSWADVRLGEWNHSFAMGWAAYNEPIAANACKESGFRIAEWKGQSVAAFPVVGPAIKKNPLYGNVDVTGYNLYSLVQGGPCSFVRVWRKNMEPTDHRSITINKYESSGSNVGLMGPVDRLEKASYVIKCEGLTDMMSANSLLPADWCAVTNSCGAGATPPKWFVHLLAEKKAVYVIHDADEAGDKGADKWIHELAKVKGGASVHQPRLPIGSDMRDFLRGKSPDGFMQWLKSNSGEARTVDDPGDEISESEEILTDLSVDVLYEQEDSAVAIYGFATKKVTILKLSRAAKSDFVQAIGSRAMHAIESDPAPGQYNIEQVRLAIAEFASTRRINNGDVDIRGIGLWEGDNGIDSDEVVVCNGTHLSIWDGSKLGIKPSPRHGTGSYMLGKADWYDHAELARLCELAIDPEWRRAKMAVAEAVFGQWSWGLKCAPQLVPGLILSTIAQSMLKWRPMVILTGQSNTGKSSLFKVIGSEETPSIFGGLSWMTSDTTRAGITQSVGWDSRAICVDEWDSHYHKERESILRAIRGATGDGGASRRGSSHQKASSFKFRHQVWIAGVYTSFDRDVDQNRFISLKLEKPSEKKWRSFELPDEALLTELSRAMLAISIVCAKPAMRLQSKLMDVDVDVPSRAKRNLSVPCSMLAIANGHLSIQSATDVFVDICSEFGKDESVDIESHHKDLLGQVLSSKLSMGPGRYITVGQTISNPAERATHVDQLEQHGLRWINEGLLFHEATYIDISDRSIRNTLMSCDGTVRRVAKIGGTTRNCVLIPIEYLQREFGVGEDDPDDHRTESQKATDRATNSIF